MEYHWVLRGVGNRALRLVRQSNTGPRETIGPVLTVREVCRRLHKSQRQVYRYLAEERLTPCARILGQWLFSNGEVLQFTQRGVPRALKPLFWDVRLSTLIVTRHRDFILGRVLESGDRAAVRWAFKTYTRPHLRAFLRGRGADLLSQRAWHFWASQLGVNPREQAGRPWRRPGRRWGGFEAAA